jgi:S1-C subfamily serine protease
MLNFPRNILLAAMLIAPALRLTARADDTAEQGRAVFNKFQRAVVTVQVVLKSSGSSGRSRETKQDVTATVVDPSGLTVTALSACDPTEIYRRVLEDYKGENEISDIKILLEDGTEVPAEIVLRDHDMDLAFLRPKTKPAGAMPAVDLAKAARVDVLDQVVSLNRLNRAAGRAYSISLSRIGAVISKPRTYYVPADGGGLSLGSPVFALNGGMVGIMVMRAVNSRGAGDYRDGLTAIILPAEDILKGAKQAPEAHPGDAEKKDSDTGPVKETK